MWRTVTSAALVVVGCVLAPLSVVGAWASNQVTDTDRYIATMTPLASNPTIQEVVADRATDEIIRQLDIGTVIEDGIEALVEQGVPPRAADALRGVAGTVASGARDFVRERVGVVVRSDAFERLWVRSNRVAHQEMVALLSGDDEGAVTVDDGTVTVDLGEVVATVKQELIDDGFTLAERVPEVEAEFTIVQSADLASAQSAFRLLDRLGTVLPLISLAFIAGGVVIARNRRRALLRAALGLAGSMVLLAIALALGRGLYLDRLPAAVSSAAAGEVFDTVVRFLRIGLRIVLVAALLLAGGAMLAGSSTVAVRSREMFQRTVQRAGGQGNEWVHRNRGVLRAGIVIVASLAFVFWDQPSGVVVLLLAALTVVALAAIEFLGRTQPSV
jgi:hypothetical protein